MRAVGIKMNLRPVPPHLHDVGKHMQALQSSNMHKDNANIRVVMFKVLRSTSLHNTIQKFRLQPGSGCRSISRRPPHTVRVVGLLQISPEVVWKCENLNGLTGYTFEVGKHKCRKAPSNISGRTVRRRQLPRDRNCHKYARLLEVIWHVEPAPNITKGRGKDHQRCHLFTFERKRSYGNLKTA